MKKFIYYIYTYISPEQKNSTFSNSRIFKNEDDNLKKYFIESRKILFYYLIIHCTLVVSECDPEIEIPCSIGYSMDSSMFPIHHDIDYVVAQHLNPIYLLTQIRTVCRLYNQANIRIYLYRHIFFKEIRHKIRFTGVFLQFFKQK